MLTARDIMTTQVISVAPETPVRCVADTLQAHRISAVPVVENNIRLVGIVSEGDLIRRLQSDNPANRSWWLTLVGKSTDLRRVMPRSHDKTAQEVMTPDVITVSAYSALTEIALLLETFRIKRVPVVQKGEIVGVVSRANLIQVLASHGDKAGSPARPSDRALRDFFLERAEIEGLSKCGVFNALVRDGVVHIWGHVHSDEQRDALRALAYRTPGIHAVDISRPIHVPTRMDC